MKITLHIVYKEKINTIYSVLRKEINMDDMVTKKTWQEFRDSGLLWWINMILHTFGWSIVFEISKRGKIIDVLQE